MTEDGNLQSISAYTYVAEGDNATIHYAAHFSNKTLITQTVNGTYEGGGWAWRPLTFSSPPLLENGQEIWFSAWATVVGAQSVLISCNDSYASYRAFQQTLTYNETYPDPFTEDFFAEQYNSIFGNYTLTSSVNAQFDGSHEGDLELFPYSDNLTYGIANSTTQAVLHNSTDAGAEVNWALSQLSDDATIYVNYIPNYPYNLTTAISDSGLNGIELFGNTTTAPTFFLAPNTAYPGFILRLLASNETHQTGWYIHDLVLDGNAANQGTAGHLTSWIQYMDNCTLYKVTIQNTAIGGGTDRGKAFDNYDCNNLLLDDCTTKMLIPGEGVTGKNDVAFTRCYNVTIENSEVLGGSGAINFFDGTHLGVARNNICTNQSMGGIVCYVNSDDNEVYNNTVTGLPNGYGFVSTQGGYINNESSESYYGTCSNNTIRNNTFTNFANGFIIGRGGNNNKIFNNSFIGCTGWSIVIDGPSNLIWNNTVSAKGGSGIRIAGIVDWNGHHNTVLGNVIDNATLGITVAYGFDNIIIGNTVTNSQAYGFSIYESPSARNYFANNTVTDSASKDVYIQSSDSSHNVFETNVFDSGLGSPVSDAGTNTWYHSNTGYADNESYEDWIGDGGWAITYRTINNTASNVDYPLSGEQVYVNGTILPITSSGNFYLDTTLITVSPYYLTIIGDYVLADTGATYLAVLTVNDPENTTYTTSSVPVNIDYDTNGTNAVRTWNIQFQNGSWLYAENQTYTVATSATINENLTATFCAHLTIDEGTTDYKEVIFTTAIPEPTYYITVTPTNPSNTTYTASSIPHAATLAGNGTSQTLESNVWNFTSGSYLFAANMTSANATFTLAVNGTYRIDFWASDAEGSTDTDSVTFTLAITEETIFNPSGAGPLNSTPTPTPSTTTPTEPAQPPDTNS
ncbi:MAG: right-handed parallel beta-helix repeat-containing protein, partial [Candidatus Bathyarchaeia archaeon]